MNKSLIKLTALALLAGSIFHLHGADAPAPKPAGPASAPTTKAGDVITIKPYGLDHCVVSGDKLGSMGDAIVLIYEGQEVKFCCNDCPKDFAKEPAKYLKIIAEDQAKAAQIKPYPLDYSLVSLLKLSTAATPIVVNYNGQELKFCQKSELDVFYKDPSAVMKKLAETQKTADKPPEKPAAK